MTAVAEAPTRQSDEAARAEVDEPGATISDPARLAAGPSAPPLRPWLLAVSWLVITVLGIGLVLASIGPVTAERDQRALLEGFRVQIDSATNEAFGLAGIEVPTHAPSRGSAVGILDIAAIGVGQVVVEGTAPDETRQGPGHAVGTGGLGQPGNSVIVARRQLFGGPFGSLGELDRGDQILVTTVQGQSVYEVEHVGTHRIEAEPEGAADPVDDEPATTPTTLPPVAADPALDEDDATAEPPLVPEGPVDIELLYGPSTDDRLTLVTSASDSLWSSDEATVVVARMQGVPFAPTPQGGRTVDDDGRQEDPGSRSALILALLVYAIVVVGTVWLHRNVPWRSAYLLSAPLLLALTIVLAEQAARGLPAWS